MYVFNIVRNVVYEIIKWIKLKINFFNASEIIDNIWIGNMIDSRDEKFVMDKNIEVIFNLTSNVPNTFEDKVIYNNIYVKDNLMKSQINILYESLDIETKKLRNYVLENKNILVHCRAGAQRSASLVAAYLIRYHNMDIWESITYIKEKREIAFTIFPHFLNALERFENLMKYETNRID